MLHALLQTLSGLKALAVPLNGWFWSQYLLALASAAPSLRQDLPGRAIERPSVQWKRSSVMLCLLVQLDQVTLCPSPFSRCTYGLFNASEGGHVCACSNSLPGYEWLLSEKQEKNLGQEMFLPKMCADK